MTSPDDATTPASASGAINRMPQSEQLFALGALLIIAADLIGGIIAERYAVDSLLWGVAALGLAAVVVHRVRNGVLPVPYNWVVRTLGLAAIVVGGRTFLYEVTANLFDRGGATILFALIAYAGVVLMGLGGLQAKKG